MDLGIYQELFNHVAFPVFATDREGVVCYKNPQTAKYQPMIRKRAKVAKHLRISEKERTVFLCGNTPYANGVYLHDEEGGLFLFLTRFQYPDGKKIMARMLESYGTEASDFVFSLKNAASKDVNVARVYADILLFTDQEKTDLGIAFYSLQDILFPLFGKLHALSVLGYRITAVIDDDFQRRFPVRISSSDLLHRVFHLLYAVLKLSESKNVAVRLTSERGAHLLIMETRTTAMPAFYRNEMCASFFSALIPECGAEFALLGRIFDFSKNVQLHIREDGIAILHHRIPYEFVPAGMSLHSKVGFTHFEKDARAFIRELKRKLLG